MTPLFPSLFEEILFWAIVTPGIVVKFYFMLSRGRRFKESEKVNVERNVSNASFLISWLALFGVPILIGYAQILTIPAWFFYPGLAFWTVGWLIASWAIFTLGHFFGSTVRVLSDHTVVQNGPYRFVRHPMHSGELLAFIGLGLAFQSLAALLFSVASYAVILVYRIPVEERLLTRELGDDYVQYMKRTKRLIPYIW